MKSTYRFSIRTLLLSFVLLFVTGGLFLYKIDSIAIRIHHVKNHLVKNNPFKERYKELIDVGSFTPLKDDSTSWYMKYHVIAHGGGINGKTYTNSLESLLNSYNNGIRLFDVDLRFTSDNHLILRHNWIENLADLEQENLKKDLKVWHDDLGQTQIFRGMAPTLSEFKATSINYKYTPLSFNDLLDFMTTHHDVYICCDTKEDVTESYNYIVNAIRKKGMEAHLDKIIVSFYRFEDYDKIMNVYPFKNAMIRQHEVYPTNYSKIIEMCIKKNIHVCNINEIFFTQDDMTHFKKLNIKLYVAVVDKLSSAKHYFQCGASGIISNWITENDLQYIK
jgi:glycerophosphoryl diester phosphodiesterase